MSLRSSRRSDAGKLTGCLVPYPCVFKVTQNLIHVLLRRKLGSGSNWERQVKKSCGQIRVAFRPWRWVSEINCKSLPRTEELSERNTQVGVEWIKNVQIVRFLRNLLTLVHSWTCWMSQKCHFFFFFGFGSNLFLWTSAWLVQTVLHGTLIIASLSIIRFEPCFCAFLFCFFPSRPFCLF